MENGLAWSWTMKAAKMMEVFKDRDTLTANLEGVCFSGELQSPL